MEERGKAIDKGNGIILIPSFIDENGKTVYVEHSNGIDAYRGIDPHFTRLDTLARQWNRDSEGNSNEVRFSVPRRER